jgi:hypothetical protein
LGEEGLNGNMRGGDAPLLFETLGFGKKINLKKKKRLQVARSNLK